MVCRLIDLALVVLKLLIFTVCGIIGFSKIEFFNFSGTGRVNVDISSRSRMVVLVLIWVIAFGLRRLYFKLENFV